MTRAEASPTGASDGYGESLEDDYAISSQKLTRCFAITSDRMFLQTRK